MKTLMIMLEVVGWGAVGALVLFFVALALGFAGYIIDGMTARAIDRASYERRMGQR